VAKEHQKILSIRLRKETKKTLMVGSPDWLMETKMELIHLHHSGQ
jgi:hypothetical protein